jgi:thiamine phosphate synthase YjbQ (UPF0047 family)
MSRDFLTLSLTTLSFRCFDVTEEIRSFCEGRKEGDVWIETPWDEPLGLITTTDSWPASDLATYLQRFLRRDDGHLIHRLWWRWRGPDHLIPGSLRRAADFPVDDGMLTIEPGSAIWAVEMSGGARNRRLTVEFRPTYGWGHSRLPAILKNPPRQVIRY